MILGFVVLVLGHGYIMPHNWWLALIIYIAAVAIIVLFGLLLYWLMRTRLPFTTYILMGGRR